MLHICVRKFDVTGTAQTFFGTKRNLNLFTSEHSPASCFTVLIIFDSSSGYNLEQHTYTDAGSEAEPVGRIMFPPKDRPLAARRVRWLEEAFSRSTTVLAPN